MLRLVILLILASPVAAFAQSTADPEQASGLTAKPLVTAERHMVVAAHPLAAEAGLEMLRKGGSAVDALIAAQLVLGVVEPQSSGLGGGAFALVHEDETLTAWDGRETAPMGAFPGMFLGPDGAPIPWIERVSTGHAVGVPGLPLLLEALHKEHGKLPWADLFAPAIRLAEEGFEVTPRLSGSIVAFAGRLLETDARAVFLPSGLPYLPGQTMRRPALAKTMRAIAENGAAAFYAGEIADQIVAAVSREPVPGSMTAEDLAGYEVIRREPLCMVYRGQWRVCSMGPPSSGATTVGGILGLLNSFKPPEGAEDFGFWHLFAEASRLTYADRAAWLGDSDFVRVPAKGLLDAGYLAERARLIAPRRAGSNATAGQPPWKEGALPLYAPDLALKDYGTTHISVVDSDGLAVSMTSSIETAFGSGRMAAGLLLNNQLTDFSAVPEMYGQPVANAVAPGKRPRSSMAPTMIFDEETGRLIALTGSPGGSRIPEYVVGSIIALLDLRLDAAQAAALFHVSQRNGATTAIEAGVAPDGLAETLAAFGHVVEPREMTSGIHIITIAPDGTLAGGADPRREGVALGD